MRKWAAVMMTWARKEWGREKKNGEAWKTCETSYAIDNYKKELWKEGGS